MQSGDCYLFDGLQVTDSAQLHCGPRRHLDPRLEPMAGYDGCAKGQSCAFSAGIQLQSDPELLCTPNIWSCIGCVELNFVESMIKKYFNIL